MFLPDFIEHYFPRYSHHKESSVQTAFYHLPLKKKSVYDLMRTAPDSDSIKLFLLDKRVPQVLALCSDCCFLGSVPIRRALGPVPCPCGATCARVSSEGRAAVTCSLLCSEESVLCSGLGASGSPSMSAASWLVMVQGYFQGSVPTLFQCVARK